jgi:hypothetical protein
MPIVNFLGLSSATGVAVIGAAQSIRNSIQLIWMRVAAAVGYRHMTAV